MNMRVALIGFVCIFCSFQETVTVAARQGEPQPSLQPQPLQQQPPLQPQVDTAQLLRAISDTANQSMTASSQALQTTAAAVTWVKDFYGFWLTLFMALITVGGVLGGWFGFTVIRDGAQEKAAQTANRIMGDFKETSEQHVQRLIQDWTQKLALVQQDHDAIKATAHQNALALMQVNFALALTARLWDPTTDEEKDRLWQEALERLEAARSIATSLDGSIMSWVLANAAYAYKRVGDITKALHYMEEALVYRPDDAVCHFNGACYASLLLQYDKAIGMLEKGLTLDAVRVRPLCGDPDLAAVEKDPRFKALMLRFTV